MQDKHGPEAQWKGMNLGKALTDAHDEAQQDIQVLVMPTVSRLPPKLPSPPASASAPQEGPLSSLARTMARTKMLVNNTATFNTAFQALATCAIDPRRFLQRAPHRHQTAHGHADCLTQAP